MQEIFHSELQRAALLPPSAAATYDQALDETRGRVRAVLAKFEQERRDLLNRERLQTESLNAMCSWESAGRPQREAGTLPVFAVYGSAKSAHAALPPLDASAAR